MNKLDTCIAFFCWGVISLGALWFIVDTPKREQAEAVTMSKLEALLKDRCA